MNIDIQKIISSPLSMICGVPGSGKSNIALQAAIKAYHQQQRVILVTTSNAQSFDLCRRITRCSNNTRVLLYHRADLDIPSILPSEGVQMATSASLFLHGPCIVLGNAAKWAWIKPPIPMFDLMIIDDASSIRESLFMQISGLAKRYLIIHDKPTSSPIIKSNTQRWSHMHNAPQRSIAQSLFARTPKIHHTLHHTLRLPKDTTDILYPHVFPYNVTAQIEERSLLIPNPKTPLWRHISEGSSLVQAHFPTQNNELIAHWIAQNIRHLLQKKVTVKDSRMKGTLSPAKIAVVCAEHTQVLLVEKALGALAKEILIDIQLHQRSIERALVFSFHPLNQRIHPAPYHWDPARLSLLLTRHRVACVLLSTSLNYTRPTGFRGLFEENSNVLIGYQAHINLQKKLTNRTFVQSFDSVGT